MGGNRRRSVRAGFTPPSRATDTENVQRRCPRQTPVDGTCHEQRPGREVHPSRQKPRRHEEKQDEQQCEHAGHRHTQMSAAPAVRTCATEVTGSSSGLMRARREVMRLVGTNGGDRHGCGRVGSRRAVQVQRVHGKQTNNDRRYQQSSEHDAPEKVLRPLGRSHQSPGSHKTHSTARFPLASNPIGVYRSKRG